MKKILFSWIFLAFTALSPAFSITLEKINLYSVVYPEQPSQQEKYAADLLADYLGRICGNSILSVSEKHAESEFLISVGQTELAEKNGLSKLPESQSYSLDIKGKNLFIRGGFPGPLNGVISFLEEDLGCRWYAEPYLNIPKHQEPGLIVIPQLPDNTLRATPRIYVPPFKIREIMYMYGTLANPESVMFFRHAPISYHSYLPKKAGACLNSPLFVHTYTRLLPPAEYFKEHPEYYALQHGKRVRQTTTSGTVCYTNSDVPQIMAKNIRKEIQKNPGYKYFSVSINDTGAAQCECRSCSSIIRRIGGPGIQVMLANKVADCLVSDYPDILLTTLVYSSKDLNISEIKAHPNVSLFLAPIGARFNQIKGLIPLQENPEIKKAIQNCRQISNHVIFWDYLDFNDLPFPNFDQVRESLRYLAAQGVTGYFADCTNNGASLTPLKKWLFAHLAWNPDLNMVSLIQEFIHAYYQNAAPEILEYVRIMRQAWWNFKQDYDAADGDGIIFSYDKAEILAMRRLFARAMKKAENNETLKGRIAREYLVFLTMVLSGNPVVIGTETYKKDYQTAKALLSYVPGNASLFQRKLPERWKKKLAYAESPRTEGYSPNTVVVKNPLTVAGMSAYLPDSEASQGKASRHRGQTPWGIQWQYFKFIDYLIPGKTYVMRMRVKTEIKNEKHGHLFELRAFHHGNKKLTDKQPSLTAEFISEDIKGKYRWINLGKIKFINPNATGMFWINTLTGADEAVWYDKMELIPIEEYKNDVPVPDKTIVL